MVPFPGNVQLVVNSGDNVQNNAKITPSTYLCSFLPLL